MDSDIIMEMEQVDDEYIKFPSSQPDSIKDKCPKYTVLTENISDEDEMQEEELKKDDKTENDKTQKEMKKR